MKAMILCMALLLALTVFASFANNSFEEQQVMAEKAVLAESYADGQAPEQVDRFEAREFVPGNVVNEREEDMAKSLLLGTFSKH